MKAHERAAAAVTNKQHRDGGKNFACAATSRGPGPIIFKVNQYWTIDIGDVSRLEFVMTRVAKSVVDAGWGMLNAQPRYKGENAGRNVYIVSQRNTTRACSSCGAFTGPAGWAMLVVRQWQCVRRGDTHDRDVNAASNVAIVGARSRAGNGLLPSMYGNEPDPQTSPPRSAPRRCKAGIAQSASAP